MFETFAKSFQPDQGTVVEARGADDITDMPLGALLRQFGGLSFRDGLYRIIKAVDLAEWKARVSLAFPHFEKRIACFGYDWMGTVFATDSGRSVDGRPGVMMFEPGTGKALIVPCNIESFHDHGLNEFGDAALVSTFHQEWLQVRGVTPSYTQCVGYKKPLFLGGKDVIENLEILDLDVYWHLMGQLIVSTRGLPEGTVVKPTISL